MPLIAYPFQPWAFIDRLVFELCPDGFRLVPMARDASAEERAAALADAEFLMGSWVTTAVKLTEGDFRAAPRLKLLQLMSAGHEHIDLDLVARYGVPVAHFGDAMASVVAEHTLLLILAVYRRLVALDAAVRLPHNAGQAEEVWPRIVRTCFANIERVVRGEPPRFLARKLE